jgi:DNA-binding transcriptional LysR family regulator
MAQPDFNLLVILDVLLAEGSVVAAAKRLQLSPSAMSRALTRLRSATGDQLLVRAGRGLVPTPHALELRERVGLLVRDAVALLRPADELDLRTVDRTFTLRGSEGFVGNFGPDLIDLVETAAPNVRLRFIQKPDKDSTPLRTGLIDLETGVVESSTAPELRTQALFTDHYIGVVRMGHSLTKGQITVERFVEGRHILVTRQNLTVGPIDPILATLGLERRITTIVGGFATALALVRATDMITMVPRRHTTSLREGLFSFNLPVHLPEFTVSMLWHPRQDGDHAHRWLRQCIKTVCASKIAAQSKDIAI